MRKDKNNIAKIVLSVCLSLIVSSTIYAINEQVSLVFFIEMFILLSFFCIITFCLKDRFNPLSFFLLNLFLGVLDIIFVVTNVRIVSKRYDISIYEKSLIIIIMWLIGFLIGFYFKIKNKNKKSLKILNTIDKYMKNANINILLLLGLIVTMWIIIIIAKTIKELGGINIAMNDFAIYRYNNQGYLTTLIPLMAIVTICLWEKKCKKLSLFSMILSFLIISLTGRRALAINTIIIPFLVYYNYREKKITNKQVMILVIPIICFVLLIGSLRNQNVKLSNDNGKLMNTLASVTNTIQYGQNVPDLIYSLEKEKIGFQGNKYLLNGILGIIPRSIWKNKGELDHSLISSRLIYNKDITYGKPIGSFGFAYLCYGYIGVIISGIITGILTKKIYSWIKTNNSVMSILIYSLTIQSVMTITNPESQVKIITLVIILLILSIMSNINQKIKEKENFKYEKADG